MASSSSSTSQVALYPRRDAQLAEVFTLIDADRSGTVEWKEMSAMLHLVHDNLTAEESKKIFNSVDKSKDGRIQRDEFVRAYMAQFASDSDEKFHQRIELTKKFLVRKPVLSKVFDHFDTDRSGSLDKGEIYRMVKLSKPKVTNEEVMAIMKKIDTNNDKKISREEFVQYFFKQFFADTPAEFETRIEETLMGRRRVKLQSLFNLYDMDGNGVLDIQEFALTLTQCGRKFVQPDDIIDALCRIDKDRNRKVDFSEWMVHMGSIVGMLDDKQFDKAINEMVKSAKEYRNKKVAAVKGTTEEKKA